MANNPPPLLQQPDKLPVITPGTISAQLARQIRRIDELEFALQRTVNAIDMGMPELALKIGRDALQKRK